MCRKGCSTDFFAAGAVLKIQKVRSRYGTAALWWIAQGARQMRLSSGVEPLQAIERFPNLVSMFFTRAKQKGGAPFLSRKADGQWQALSWAEVARRVAALASALKASGLRPGDPVVLVSENRPEFCIADLAIMAAGGITVPTYTTNTTRDHQHILTDSGARAVIV
jgi:long-chain acyl-CoA synthetase